MKKKLIICTLIFITIIIITILLIKNNIKFYLKGENNYIISYGNNYEEKGYNATIFNHDLKEKVKITTDLNTNKLGTYNIKYELKYLNKKYNLTRNIKIIDDIKPTIELKGKSEIELFINNNYIEQGAIAIDNYDGDLTDKITISGEVDTNTTGIYQITYQVKDTSNNQNTITRKITVKDKDQYHTTEGYNNPNNPIIKYINDNNYRVSIGYYNLTTGDTFYYKENKIYYGASLIKTLSAIYLYDNNLVNDTIKSHIKKAISVSDNNSYFYLLNYIGKNNLKNYGYNLGAKNTLIGPDNFGMTTVKDQMIYLKKLYSIIQKNEELKSFFINDYYNNIKINNITVMHKYGDWEHIYHDVGIFLEEQPYILVVLTEHGYENYQEIVQNISNIMYKYHLNNK